MYKIYLCFFYGKDKVNELSSHLMGSDHWLPRHCITTQVFQIRCLPLKPFLNILMSYRPGITATARLFHSCVVCGKKLVRNFIVVEFHGSRWLWYFNLYCTVRLEYSAVGIRSNSSLNTPHGISARELGNVFKQR